jgi:hypothetical protein
MARVRDRPGNVYSLAFLEEVFSETGSKRIRRRSGTA